MRRGVLWLALGALIFGVSFAGAKLATVTNPMSTDLDANHYSILNGSAIYGETFQATSGYGVGLGGNLVFNDGSFHLLVITSCQGDPSVAGFTRNQGSLCLSLDGLYRKTGPSDTDWVRLG